MYYESSQVESVLTCAFCSSPFVDGVVKLIADCGASVCAECSREIEPETRFLCRACDHHHTAPRGGLVENKALARVLRLRPEAKAVSQSARSLKKLLGEVRDKLKRLEALDEEAEINDHCDRLAEEVGEALDSGVQHLNKLAEQMLQDVAGYRQRLLDARTSPTSGRFFEREPRVPKSMAEVEFGALWHQLDYFSREWEDYFGKMNRVVSDDEIQVATCQLQDFQTRLDEMEVNLQDEIFKERVLRFRDNSLFHQETDHLGRLEYELSMSVKKVRGQSEAKVDKKFLFMSAGHSDWPYQAIFLPDERIASSSNDDAVLVCQRDDGKAAETLRGHAGHVNCLAVLSNGWLASGSVDGLVKVWSVEERRQIRSLRGHTDGVFSLKALPDGHLASCSWDDTIRVWNPYWTHGGRTLLLTIPGHGCKGFVVHLGLLASGALVTCSNDSTDREKGLVKVWSPNNGKMLKTVPTDSKGSRALLVLSDDRVAVGFQDGLVKLIDLADQSRTKTLTGQHQGGVYSLLQLSNGYLLTGGSEANPNILVWSSTSGSLIQTIATGHTGSIRSLSLSRSGTILASGSVDRTVRTWRLTY